MARPPRGFGQVMDQSNEFEKDETIDGPLTLALTPTGVDGFLQRGQKIKKHRFFDGTEDYGLDLPVVSFRALQKMAMTGVVYKIERSTCYFAKERKHLMELTKCFAQSTVYRQFERRMWEIISKSELSVQWNRTYPRLNIGPGINTQAQAFQVLLEKSKDFIVARKQEVLKAVQTVIQKDSKSLDDEKRALILLAIRYINAIDPVVWLVIAMSKDSGSAGAVVAELQKLLVQYVGRSELPEYLALMIVELILMVSGVKADSELSSAGEKNELVHISFELGSLKKSQEERTRVRIQIGNEGSDFQGLRTIIDQSSSLNLREKSLDVFFSGGGMTEISRQGSLLPRSGGMQTARPGSGATGTAEPKNGGNELGIYYLSYLKDACKKMDISFDSFVNIVPHTNRTLINLVLAI